MRIGLIGAVRIARQVMSGQWNKIPDFILVPRGLGSGIDVLWSDFNSQKFFALPLIPNEGGPLAHSTTRSLPRDDKQNLPPLFGTH